MTMTLGRVGVDIALADPATWTRNGTSVSLSGFTGLGVSSLTDRITLGEQLLGLVNNPDEPFIACTWSLESWFDGYYRVGSVSVDVNKKYDGYFPYSITLERVADGASPTIDVSLLGALRTNGNSVTTGRANSWAPSAMQGGYAKGGVFTSAGLSVAYNQAGSAQSRTTETGAVISVQTTGASTVTNGYGTFDVAPASYYNGHCTIRSGSTLRRVIGARMKSLPANWEICNGLLRVTPLTASKLQIEIYDGAAWEETKSVQITQGSAPTSNYHSLSSAWGDISVLRNSPECVSIRLIPAYSGGSASSGSHIDLTLQRGRYFLDVFIYADIGVGTNPKFGIGMTTAEAATAITGGIRATSNDAAGNRYVLAVSQAATNELTQGAVTITTAASAVNAMVGFELGGSGAAAPNTAQNIIDEWHYPFEERMAPRAR